MGNYMSKPNLKKQSLSGESRHLKYGVSSMQGWRHSMEDAHIVNLALTADVSLFAVFDGHGGHQVAKFCEKFFPEALLKNENFKNGNYKLALQESYLKMDDMLINEPTHDLLKDFNEDCCTFSAGCTANVVLITKTHLHVANAGDSRAYLYTYEGRIWPLSMDHKPELEGETKRIRNAGGFVLEGRVNSVLNLTRAIGDLDFKKNTSLGPQEQIITSFPDVISMHIPSDANFLIMGCDGIWETMDLTTMCHLVEKRIKGNNFVKLSTICEELLDKLVAPDATQGTGCDNMTMILVKFKESQPKK